MCAVSGSRFQLVAVTLSTSTEANCPSSWSDERDRLVIIHAGALAGRGSILSELLLKGIHLIFESAGRRPANMAENSVWSLCT